MTYYIAYYSRNPRETFFGDQPVDPKKIEVTHRFMRCLRADNLEDAYLKCQGENWSPNGELRDYVEATGLRHTSLSVGDVLYDWDHGTYHKVAMAGFEDVD